MPLFEVAVIELPTKKDAENGVGEKLVFGPKAVVAKDAQNAGIVAVMGESNFSADMTRIQVLVRPFA